MRINSVLEAATPELTEAKLKAVLEVAPAEKLAEHIHGTSGRALENIEVGAKLGIPIFDASFGGLGGCPYASGSRSNVNTVSVNALLISLGFITGLDAEYLGKAAAFAKTLRLSGTEF